MELWLIPIIGLLSVATTIVSSKGALFDNRYKWYNRLNKRGKIVAVMGFVIVGLSILQFVIVRKNEMDNELKLIEQKRNSDSIIYSEINKGIEYNRKKLFADLSQALAKEKIMLDTVAKQILSLRDSVKTVIIQSPHVDPIVLIRKNDISHLARGDTIDMHLSVISTQAQAKKFNMSAFCVINYLDGRTRVLGHLNLIEGRINIPKDQLLTVYFSFVEKRQIEKIEILINGSFKQNDKVKEVSFNDLYIYNYSTQITGFLEGNEKLQFLKKYNLK